jgi:hypothetical protein
MSFLDMVCLTVELAYDKEEDAGEGSEEGVAPVCPLVVVLVVVFTGHRPQDQAKINTRQLVLLGQDMLCRPQVAFPGWGWLPLYGVSFPGWWRLPNAPKTSTD